MLQPRRRFCLKSYQGAISEHLVSTVGLRKFSSHLEDFVTFLPDKRTEERKLISSAKTPLSDLDK